MSVSIALQRSFVSIEDGLSLTTADIRIEKSASNIHQTLDPSKKITATQAKALNAVQYKLQKEVKDRGLTANQFHKNHPGNLVVTMPSQEFRRLINCESRNTDYLRKIMMEIKNLSAGEDTFDPETGKGRLFFRNLFIAAEYTDSTFSFQIPEETTRLLVTDAPSAVIDVLTVAQKLSSKYAVFLNDLLEEWSYKESSDDFKIVIEDSKFRNLMKIPFKLVGRTREYSYPQPAILIRKAVAPAVEEINDANLRFEIKNYGHVKKDGTIHWIFEVVSKKSLVIHQFTVKNSVEIAEVRKQLKDIKVSDEAIRGLMNNLSSDYELAYLRYNIDIVKSQMKRGKVSNSGGLFMSCIDNNRESFEPVWREMRLQRDVEIALKKREYEDHLEKVREANVAELTEIKAGNTLIRLKAEPDALSLLLESFKEHLSKIPVPAAKKMLELLESRDHANKVIDDPLFYRFLLAEVRKNLTEKEIEDFSRSKGTTLHI